MESILKHIRSLFGGQQEDKSFLPEDYLARRAERRTSIISVVLFCLVMLGVTAAFFVSNRELNQVREYQRAINVRYAEAAKELETLKSLEDVEAGLMQWAEVTTALYEKVPRSIVMAELINRMPDSATLTEIELTSTRMQEPIRPVRTGSSASSRSLTSQVSRKAEDGDDGETPIMAPAFRSRLVLVGVVPQHEDVAKYVATLHQSQFLRRVELIFTETTSMEESRMMKFRIEADIRPDADARQIAPLASERAGGEGRGVPENPDFGKGWDFNRLMKLGPGAGADEKREGGKRE